MRFISGWDDVASSLAVPRASDAPAFEQLVMLADARRASLYAVADGACNDTVVARLAAGAARYETLFKGAARKDIDVSPFLVELRAASELSDWLTSDGASSHCGIFLISRDGFDRLLAHLRRFLMVVADGGKRYYFRFYDPRILRAYLPTCTDAELTLFFGKVDCFVAISPGGEEAHLFERTHRPRKQSPSDPEPRDSLGRLIIRPPQMDAFTASAVSGFEDRVCVHLNKFFPEQCEALGQADTRDAIRYGIARAAAYGIESERGVCKYIDLMFAFGRDYDVDDDLPWAAGILADETITDPKERIEKLYRTALRRIREAQGIVAGEGD